MYEQTSIPQFQSQSEQLRFELCIAANILRYEHLKNEKNPNFKQIT